MNSMQPSIDPRKLHFLEMKCFITPRNSFLTIIAEEGSQLRWLSRLNYASLLDGKISDVVLPTEMPPKELCHHVMHVYPAFQRALVSAALSIASPFIFRKYR